MTRGYALGVWALLGVRALSTGEPRQPPTPAGVRQVRGCSPGWPLATVTLMAACLLTPVCTTRFLSFLKFLRVKFLSFSLCGECVTVILSQAPFWGPEGVSELCPASC